MFNEAESLDFKACKKLSENFLAPIQVIHAENGMFVNDKYSYHSFSKHKTNHCIIEGTQHCFHENNACESLIKQTKQWFDSF